MTRTEKLKELEQESTDLVRAATSIKVTSDPQYEEAAHFLLVVKKFATQIEDHHEPMRKKSYDAYQEVLKAKRTLLTPVNEAEVIVKDAMASFMTERQVKQDEIAEKIKAGGKGKVREAPKPQGVTTRTTYDYEIVNEKDIHEDYMVPDYSMISRMVNSLGEDAEDIVGGIKVIKKTQIAASRGV